MKRIAGTLQTLRALLCLALLACGGGPARAAAGQKPYTRDEVAPRGSLAEVRGLRRVALLVSRALVVDARDPALIALEDYRHALEGQAPRQHDAAARRVADKINKYIRKYRTTTAVEDLADADLVLVFKVTGQRRSALPDDPFVWGKLFVIAVGSDRTPRVVWESEGDNKNPEDATGDFIKAFRNARGEK
ncbi:MAG: hypothetical protein JOZ96_02960 [Acidobacteria bacterium]|nr:hypothetical protein [Acidobacteriota bacterium]